MDRPNRQPTLKSIAEKTGVTANTVSLALRDSPLVLPQTKARIQKAAREMGYVHNVLAGSLRSGRSHTIAILFGDVSNPLFAQRIRELSKSLQQQGYQVLILNTEECAKTESQAIRTAVSHQVDGIILCPCQQGQESLDLLRQYRVPFVFLGREFLGASADAVVWDDLEGARMVTQHLLQMGCRRIVFINGPKLISSAILRQNGYETVMREAGLVPCTVHAAAMSGSVAGCLETLRKEHSRYDGLFVFSDLMALEASSWLLQNKFRLPEDVAVAGFDDILSDFNLPFGLTSVACNRKEEAEAVVKLLLRRINDPDAAFAVQRLPVRLVVRDSSHRRAATANPPLPASAWNDR